MPETISPGLGVLCALFAFIGASIWLGGLAQKRMEGSSFLKGYFLGNRGLGAWAVALTATVQSGGTFMGFPALVYSHGWTVSLWICGYMVVPLTGFAIVGKRLAQLSRRSSAITVPDLFRARFDSPACGLLSSLLIILFMTCMMVAQFKAGAIVMKLAWPAGGHLALSETESAIDWPYYTGLVIFSIAVLGYTLVGGFLASVWTDLFQSVMMLIGVMILLLLIVPMAGGLEKATYDAAQSTGPEYVFGPGYVAPPPEPKEGNANSTMTPPKPRRFLPPGLAFSFFFVWVVAGFASPASQVRVMASQSTQVIRRSIFLLSCYNCLIYVPLIAICIAGRALIPDLDKADEIIPRLALLGPSTLPGGSFVTGLILAAPFGAVMATVSCYLLVISSGLVKDIYLRFVRPTAQVNEVRYATYAAMIFVGLLAIAANIRPVRYLQALVVFSGASGAASFATPLLMAAYWQRATAAGALSAMVAGAGTMFSLFGLGWVQRFAERTVAAGNPSAFVAQLHDLLGPDPGIGIADPFRAYYLLGLDPIIWSLAASFTTGIVVSLMSPRPSPELVRRFFGPRP